MAFNSVQHDLITFRAGVDLSAAQNCFVIQDSTTGYVKLPTAAHQYATGVLQNVPTAGYSTSDGTKTTSFEQLSPVVAVAGITPIVVDAAYAIGTFIMPKYDAIYNGYGTVYDGTNASGSVGGRAVLMEASTVIGDIVTCRLLD